MTKRLTLEDVRSRFAESGWELLALEYNGNLKPLTAKCPVGHITEICRNNLQKGQGCRVCAGNEGYSYEEVSKVFRDAGCELLTTEYKNVLTSMLYRCVCGHQSKIRFADFRVGVRCQKCKSKKLSESLRASDCDIAEFCSAQECQFLRSWIQNKRTRIAYICKCGDETEAYWTNFKRFPNCKRCGSAKVSGPNCYMYDPDRDAVALRKKFRKICGQHIRRFMHATGNKKTRRTHELLGYTPQQLQDHILNHPNFAACKDVIWHVDHIFPLQAFLDHGIHDLSIINALENLRPLPGPENLSKADTYNEIEFLKWLKEHLTRSGLGVGDV